MYKFKALDSFSVSGKDGVAFVVESPIECERSLAKKTLGDVIEIDGKLYDLLGIEMVMPNSLLKVGEKISLLVNKK